MPVYHSDDVVTTLTIDHHYRLAYECRDIGYGVEAGEGEFVYRGVAEGKRQFAPVDGSPDLYLFDDEFEVTP